MLRKFLLIGASVLALTSSALAAPLVVVTDETYQLQERCGHDAAALFAQDKQSSYEKLKAWGITKTDPIVNYDYVSNYSVPMQGCFILMTTTISGVSGGHPDWTTAYKLIDVNTNRLLGSYEKSSVEYVTYNPVPHLCKFNGVECSSEAEWRAKITPYVRPPSD
jgi:hypothetical protein